jgi:hypothetical protein
MVMKRMAILNLVVMTAGYLLSFRWGIPEVGYPILIGSIVLFVWTAKTAPIADLRRLLLIDLTLSVVIFLTGKSPLLGVYLLCFGAAPLIYHGILFKRPGGHSDSQQ